MRRIISALLISISSTLVLAQGTQPLQLADGAPDRHVVTPGDTLWGIAAKFLNDPYRWGELWKLNADEIKNPQLIYPGQVIALDKSGNQPRLKLVTVHQERREYVEATKKGIPTIPAQEIEPFLSEPRVLDAAGLDAAPRVVAVQGDRVIAGAGDTIYTTEVTAAHKVWQLFRPGKPLLDPIPRKSWATKPFTSAPRVRPEAACRRASWSAPRNSKSCATTGFCPHRARMCRVMCRVRRPK
jgi:LysM repeat protein